MPNFLELTCYGAMLIAMLGVVGWARLGQFFAVGMAFALLILPHVDARYTAHFFLAQADIARVDFWADPLISFQLLWRYGPGSLGLLYARVLFIVYACVHVYSVHYLGAGSHRRYFGLLGLFLVGMLTLMLAASPLALLVGWETIGVAGYGLVAYYRKEAGVGQRAGWVFYVNRLGDMALLAAVCLHLNGFAVVHAAIVGAFYLLAAFVKSVQLPFSPWVTWAMVGPTPVSALLHAATLVVAGVVLAHNPIISPLVDAAYASAIGPYLHAIALATMLWASVLACLELNLKKLLAYSTVAHVSLMLLAPAAAFGGYLAAHAFFKAFLFLALGLLHSYVPTDDSAQKLAWHRISAQGWVVAVGVVLALGALNGLPGFTSHAFKNAALAPLLSGDLDPFVWMYVLLTGVYSLRFGMGWLRLAQQGLRSSLWLMVSCLALVPQLFISLADVPADASHGTVSLLWVASLLGGLAWLLVRRLGLQKVKMPALSETFVGLTTNSVGVLASKFAHGEERTQAQMPLLLARITVVLSVLLATIERTVLKTVRYTGMGLVAPLRLVIDDQGRLALGRAVWVAAAMGVSAYLLW